MSPLASALETDRSPHGPGNVKMRLAEMTSALCFARINDDRKIAHWSFDQVFRTVSRPRVKEERVAGLHQIGAVTVPVTYLSRQHEDELHARMPEVRVRHRFFRQRDQVRLDPNCAAKGVAEQIV